MRRQDRQVTDNEKIKQAIMECDCCRLAFSHLEGAYIVPLNFGYEELGTEKIFYFHGSKKGRKIDMVNQVRVAGFELDTNHKLNNADEACDFSFRFISIIGTGKVEIVESLEEKIHGLDVIMAHYSNKTYTYPENMLNGTSVIKLTVKEFECKEHL